MKKIRSILVDDEEGARNILSNLLLRFCPEVELLGAYKNLPEAVQGIEEHRPDLVFLDIEMPNYAGYEIVDFFDEVNFEMVFVTAYDRYAIKAFEISAVDYLLKPIEIERLREAVGRVQERLSARSRAAQMDHLKRALKREELQSLIVSEKGLQYVIQLKDIIAIEAQESYSVVHTEERNFLVSKNLRHFENLLDSQAEFLRVHKSWIVNLTHLQSYAKTALEIHLKGDVTARLSKYKKADFERLIQ